MNYSQVVAEDLRLAILQLLAKAPNYAHNEHVLSRALSEVGHAISGDRLRTELAWLAEQQLASVNDVADVVRVAKLTRRGEDVALGLARVPGVARPRPGE